MRRRSAAATGTPAAAKPRQLPAAATTPAAAISRRLVAVKATTAASKTGLWPAAAGNSTANNQVSVRALGGVRLAANVQVGTSSAEYRRLELGGGNALGYFYGSFPKFSDGIHLSYNYFADASGAAHVFAPDGATSRLTVGYGFVGLYVGIVNRVPSIQRLLANSTGVTLNGTFNTSSERNVKQDFSPISSSQILEKVTQLPLSEWSYKED